MDDKTRALLMIVRECLIILLGAIEKYLGIERTKQPRHQRYP